MANVTNTSSTQAVVLSDINQVSGGQQSQWQDGIKSVTLAPSATVSVKNIEAGQSTALQTALLAGTATVNTSIDPNEAVAGVLFGSGGVALAGAVKTAALTTTVIAFTPNFQITTPASWSTPPADITKPVVLKILPGYGVTAANQYHLVHNSGLDGGAVVGASIHDGTATNRGIMIDNSAGGSAVRTALLVIA